MMNQQPKKLAQGNPEQGIALLFALGILSLLLVMALAFATNSIFDQKTAYNNANLSAARMLALAQLNRVNSMLQAYGDGLKHSRDEQVKQSSSADSPWLSDFGTGTRSDMLARLTTKSGTATIFTWTAALNNNLTWEFFKVKDGTTNGRIIGRAAYVVIPGAGLDPGACVKKGVDENADSEQRLGVDVSEINLMSLSPADIAPALAAKFNYTAAAALPEVQPTPGLYSGGASWVDYNNLFSLTGITDGNLRSKLMKWLVIDSAARPEFYWIDRNANNYEDDVITTNEEYYDRFNLARTDWETNFKADWEIFPNTEKMSYNILLDSNGDGVPDILPRHYDGTANDGIGIPWLAFFGYDKDGNIDVTAGGTFGNDLAGVIARRRQIAANLVDYCRVNTAPPTSDIDPLNWGTTDPTFTGNKRTPYLNEAGIKISANITRINTDIYFTVSSSIFTELINIYPDLPDVKAEVTIYYDYAFNARVEGGVVGGVNLTNQTKTVAINGAKWKVSPKYTDKAEEQLFAPWSFTSGGWATDKTAQITDFKLTIKKMVMSCDVNNAGPVDGNFDVAKINRGSSFWTPVNTVMTTATGTMVDGYIYLSFSANDPRQNLNFGDWSLEETAAVGGTGTAGDPYVAPGALPTDIRTFAAKNKYNGIAIDPSAITTANGDKESVTEPAYNGAQALSTAYINHGPIDSPWEVGFIHRGAAWQTINLKEYDVNKAIKLFAATPQVIPGGSTYSDRTNGGGDANILDQIKMTNAASAHKVNINSTFVDSYTGKNVLLQALLAKIRIGSSPTSPGTGGTMIAISNNLDNLIAGITTRQNDANYLTRAEVANAKTGTVYDLIDGTCGIVQDNDAKQEELIGKFVNLTDISGQTEYFTVIIIAQAIKDVGGIGAEIPIAKRNSSGTAVTIQAQMGRFDYDSANNLYADEITAEQKIKVLIHRNSGTGVCKVLSYEYVE